MDQHRQAEMQVAECVVHLTARGVHRQCHHRRFQHVAHPSEPVDAGARLFGDDADRCALCHDDGRAMGAFGQQSQRVGHRIVAGEDDRGVGDEVPGLHERDRLGRGRQRQILGQDNQTAAPRNGLGHSLAGDRGHVRDHQRDRRPGAVGRRDVHVEA